ncbi:MAG: M20/M25/M40 family metallo-hydrolase [Chloroflexota bacterium]
MATASEYATQHQDTFRERFIDLVKIKSISTDPAFKEDVRQAADWIAERMTSIGLHAELIDMPEGRHPCVLGIWDGAGENAPTVLVYCHYDVQPAVVEDGWHTPPFEPTIVDGKLVARGATDSKVHVMAWLSAVESLIATDSCPVNIKLLFEGEEESGGENISALIAKHPDKVKADIAIISDGIIRSPEQPAIIYGLRGIMTMEVHVYGPQKDLHSGHFGGTVHNPAQALAEIITGLHDADGTVTVDGFYDDVLALDDEERALLAESDDSIAEEWEAVANAPKTWGEPDYTLHERVGARPTLEINGMSGGYTGDGFKTVLPAHAFAKISCRLVPNQDPKTILALVQARIRELAPDTVRVEFERVESEAPAIRIDYNGEIVQAAYAAYEHGWGVAPVFERAGGSVPITHDMLQITENLAIMGFSYKGGAAHGPNENIPLAMFYKGIQTAIYFLTNIAKDKDTA